MYKDIIVFSLNPALRKFNHVARDIWLKDAVQHVLHRRPDKAGCGRGPAQRQRETTYESVSYAWKIMDV